MRSICAGMTAGACITNMLGPSGPMLAGHSGHSARMVVSHCSSIPRNRRGRFKRLPGVVASMSEFGQERALF